MKKTMAYKRHLRRCTVCRHHFATVGVLRSHLMQEHSKIQIVRKLFQSCVLNNTSNVIIKSKHRQGKKHEPNNNLVEVKTFDTGPKGTLKETKKSKKKLKQVEIKKIRKVTKSLHEHTGEFYECHCMDLTPNQISPDTKSSPDTYKTYYCNFCGNGYQTIMELTEHEKLHQIQCRICSQYLNIGSYRDHFQQHILRVYACHICGFECICKEVLTKHLEFHSEQQTFENILSMEQEFNAYGYSSNHFFSGNYHADMHNLLFFLTYPNDQGCARSLCKKMACQICFEQVFIFEYQHHLKIVHSLGN